MMHLHVQLTSVSQRSLTRKYKLKLSVELQDTAVSLHNYTNLLLLSSSFSLQHSLILFCIELMIELTVLLAACCVPVNELRTLNGLTLVCKIHAHFE